MSEIGFYDKHGNLVDKSRMRADGTIDPPLNVPAGAEGYLGYVNAGNFTASEVRAANGCTITNMSPPAAHHTTAGKTPTMVTYDEAADRGQEIHRAFQDFGAAAGVATGNLEKFIEALGVNLDNPHVAKQPTAADRVYGIPIHEHPAIPDDTLIFFGKGVDLDDLFRADPDIQSSERAPNFALSNGLYRPDPHAPPFDLWRRAMTRARELGHSISWRSWISDAADAMLPRRGLRPYLPGNKFRSFRVTVEPADREPYHHTSHRRIEPLTADMSPYEVEHVWFHALCEAGIFDDGGTPFD